MNPPAPEFQRLVSATILRLRMRSPFFATLALFARIEARFEVATAATDGRDLFIHPDYLASLPPAQQDGLLLHEVLHAALLHIPRRGPRERQRWNIAADIVVNGVVVRDAGLPLPPGALRDARLEKLSVEEVYELLGRKGAPVFTLSMADLALEPDGAGGEGSLEVDRRRALEAHWRQALYHAEVVARSLGYGAVPAGLMREVGGLEPARLDWRAHLWRFLARTPCDFQGFDRRFIGRGLYLEALEGESVRVAVAVDTSGSITALELRAFLSEVVGILRSYPHLEAEIYFADSALYGPFPVEPDRPLPRPVGGGGTDFRPFFEAIEGEAGWGSDRVAIYFTDGEGQFPARPPRFPVLWLLTPGGIDAGQLPFGEAVRLIDP